MQPDVLVIDEVLSVGDTEFQVRSFQRLFELRERGVAGLLVSHDLHTVEALCDRLLWIEHGEVQALDSTPDVLRAYRRHLQGDVDLPALREASVDSINLMPEGRIGTGEVTIASVRILGSDEHPTQTLIPGDPVTLEIECVAKQRVENADLVLTMEHEGLKPTMIRGSDHGFKPIFEPGRHLIRVRFEECLLNLGSYRLSVALMKGDDIYRFYDHHIRLHSFAVHSPLPSSLEPLLRIPATFEVAEVSQPKTMASSPSAPQ
jgi:energy-coupling factor transporter ATP-binding protein EcfA2